MGITNMPYKHGVTDSWNRIMLVHFSQARRQGGCGGSDTPPEPVAVGKLATSVGKMMKLP